MRQGVLILSVAAVTAVSLAGQQSVGLPSVRPPNEDIYVYREVPDVSIQTGLGNPVPLSGIWNAKPVLLTLVFTRCGGVCSPFLRSLRSAIRSAGGLGTDYRVVVLSFDSRDTLADMDRMAQQLGEKSDPNWIFGVVSPRDTERLAEATGFWFQWDGRTRQYDHPAVLMVVKNGRLLRILAGATVPPTRLAEVVEELRGKFVAAYPLPGNVAFRCFEYDAASNQFRLDWGILLLVAPGTMAALATACIFGRGRGRVQYTLHDR